MATLVYSLDAGNTASYPGSGSSWSDISGNTYSPVATATLYNAPTFTTEGTLKYIKFASASQQYADFPMAAQNAGAFPSTTLAYQIYQQSQSIAIWVRVDSALQPWIDPAYNAGYQGTIVTSSLSLAGNENVQFDISAGNCGTVAGTSAISAGWRSSGSKFGAGSLLPSIGQWYFLVGVYRKTGALTGFIDFYVNGFLVGTTAATSGSGDVFSGTFVQNNYLARSALANGQGAKPASIVFSDISVSQFKIYQGALSASEILTLFRASAAPFGYSLMATLSPLPKMQFFSTAGTPLVGGKLYTYAAGTTTPLATYTSQSGVTANTNPIILDSRGEANVWLSSAAYKLKLTTSADVEIWTVDNVGSGDQFGTSQLLSSVSGSDTITANVTSPNFTAYAAGQMFNFVAAAANTTTSVTLNLNSLGAKSVTKTGATALAVGDIKLGQLVSVVYDGTRFQLVGAISLSSPPPIGDVTPNTGAFSTLSATSTVSGAGFTSYMASPPAIGGTAPGTGKFTTLTATSNVYSTQDASPASVILTSCDSSSGTSAYSNLQMRRGRGTTASPTALANADTIGYLQFYGYNGSAYTSSASFRAVADGAFSGSNNKSYITLNTAQAGTSVVESFRWTAEGDYYVGTTSSNLGTGNSTLVGHTLQANGRATHSCSGQSALVVNRLSGSGSVVAVAFLKDGNGVGNIYVDSTSTTYATSSDYRLKMDVTPMTGALTLVKRMRPVDYLWVNGRKPGSGFLAHELQEVFPDAVTGAKDAVDANGEPDYQSVDYSKLVPTLVAAMQEQQAIIDSLKVRLAKLEAV